MASPALVLPPLVYVRQALGKLLLLVEYFIQVICVFIAAQPNAAHVQRSKDLLLQRKVGLVGLWGHIKARSTILFCSHSVHATGAVLGAGTKYLVVSSKGAWSHMTWPGDSFEQWRRSWGMLPDWCWWSPWENSVMKRKF
ncbi:hypothetical protein EGW08_009612 [Elysia chlorotica]|uniref:Uncharacterized protein n=1 Tax=Elysia chlorotica TaxID=188477 RepID=A0A433TLY7_ELYCH|nr:hypothetical protein EGW08_009612 [Elysia chlorotica]